MHSRQQRHALARLRSLLGLRSAQRGRCCAQRWWLTAAAAAAAAAVSGLYLGACMASTQAQGVSGTSELGALTQNGTLVTSTHWVRQPDVQTGWQQVCRLVRSAKVSLRARAWPARWCTSLSTSCYSRAACLSHAELQEGQPWQVVLWCSHQMRQLHVPSSREEHVPGDAAAQPDQIRPRQLTSEQAHLSRAGPSGMRPWLGLWPRGRPP